LFEIGASCERQGHKGQHDEHGDAGDVLLSHVNKPLG
jgi:hypothetical protein